MKSKTTTKIVDGTAKGIPLTEKEIKEIDKIFNDIDNLNSKDKKKK